MAVTPLQWEEQVAPQIVGTLPGVWKARGGYLSRVSPDGHLLWHVSRQVTRSGGYSFHAVIQPLYLVTDVVESTLGLDVGHGVAGVRSYFTTDDVETVPTDEIRSLLEHFAVPYLGRHGRDLKSFVKLARGFARQRPHVRGTWSTEAGVAGGYAFLGDWRSANRAWRNCLEELSQFSSDVAPELRQLATQAVDARDSHTHNAVIRRLEDNERRMRQKWNLAHDQ